MMTICFAFMKRFFVCPVPVFLAFTIIGCDTTHEKPLPEVTLALDEDGYSVIASDPGLWSEKALSRSSRPVPVNGLSMIALTMNNEEHGSMSMVPEVKDGHLVLNVDTDFRFRLDLSKARPLDSADNQIIVDPGHYSFKLEWPKAREERSKKSTQLDQ